MTVSPYEHATEAFIGFDLILLRKGAVISKASLVLDQVFIYQQWPTKFELGFTTTPWNEATLAWNNRPAILPISDVEINEGLNELDVTSATAAAVVYQNKEISFTIAVHGLTT